MNRRYLVFSAPDEPKVGESTTVMDRWRWVVSAIVVMLLGIAMFSLAQAPAAAMQAGTATPALDGTLPTIPPPVAVQVDPKTTALLILDVTSTICAPQAACVATLPVYTALLKQARDAQAFVAYSDTADTSTILAQVAPQANDVKVTGRADKFAGTNLDDLLKAKGIKTVIIVGYVANGAVLYTAFGANLRNYTVVVPVDGTGAGDPFVTIMTFFQLLNEPGLSNPDNKPLAEGRVTLSRSDLITFVAGAAPPQPLTPAQPATQPTSAATRAPAEVPITATPVSPSAGVSSLPIENLPPGPGRAMLVPYCDGCHSPLCGLLSKLTVDHWRTVRANHRTRVWSLSDADFQTLFDYIMSNFNDTQPEPNLPPEIKQRATCSAI